MIEYTCRDCGHRIIAYCFPDMAEPVLCATCGWIREHVPPRDQEAARERLGVPLTSAKEHPSITCPRCGLTSYHPKDIAEGYCGQCHDWTGVPSAKPDR